MKKHKTATFPKARMLNLINGGSDALFEVVQHEFIDHTRWSVSYEIVFRDVVTNVFYRAHYSQGATEYQDETPWEYEDEVIASIVVPREVTVTQYFPLEVDA